MQGYPCSIYTVYHSMFTRTSWGSGSVYLRMLSSKSTPRELRCSTRGWVSCVPPTPLTPLCMVGHVIMLRNNTPPPSPHAQISAVALEPSVSTLLKYLYCVYNYTACFDVYIFESPVIFVFRLSLIGLAQLCSK